MTTTTTKTTTTRAATTASTTSSSTLPHSSSRVLLAKRQSSSLDQESFDALDENGNDEPTGNPWKKRPHPSQPQSSSSSSSSSRRQSKLKNSSVMILFLVVILMTVAGMELDWMTILSWTTTRLASGTIQTKHQSPLPSLQSSSSSLRPSYYVYTRRGRSMTLVETEELSRTWGAWTCTNRRSSIGSSSSSSSLDFYSQFENRDVPLDQFPSTSWQRNGTYVTEFLQQAIALVNRTMEAILVEYGKAARFGGNDDDKEKNDEWNTKLRWAMFEVDRFDNDYFSTATGSPPSIYDKSHGGWTTHRTWIDGLQRRLWHAILTEDSFVVVVGGHSAAAGQGNQFLQSYALQVQRILEPVLARLGVAMEARNMAQGGLGTVQSALASKSIYGPDIDLLVWDSGMTEPNGAHVDLFARQGLIRPTTVSTSPLSSSVDNNDDNTTKTRKNTKTKQYHCKVPILWNLQPWSILTELHDQAFVDVGGMFSGSRGIGRATTLEDIDQMPYAMRYMKCEPALDNAYCKAMEYNSTCWIQPSITNSSNNNSSTSGTSMGDNDIPIPPTLQREYPGGRAKWHPGFRKHQLTGRVLTMTILRALYEALVTWQEHHHDAIAAVAMEQGGQQVQDGTTSFLLPSDFWHVSEHYQRIQAALKEVTNTATTATAETSTNNDKEPVTMTTTSPKLISPCFELADKIPARVCQLSLRVSRFLGVV
jgi:hypothetical protein